MEASIEGSAPRNSRSATLLALLAIVLLATALRFYGLGSESLWRDEGTSIYLAGHSVSHILDDRANFAHGPLYFLTLRGWVLAFGNSEFAARSLSAILGVLTVPLIYLLGAALFRKRGAGLVSALILATCLFHVRYSQEARMYSMCALLATASMFFFIRLLRRDDTAARIGYVLCSLLLLYTHNSGWAIIGVQNLAVVVRRFSAGPTTVLPLRRWFIMQASLVLFFSPWLVAILTHEGNVSTAGYVSLSKFRNSLKSYAGSYLLLTFHAAALAILLLPARIRSYLRMPARPEQDNWIIRHRRVLFAAAWVAVPLLLLGLLSLLLNTRMMSRYTIVGSLGMYLLSGLAVSSLPSRSCRMAAVGLLLALCIGPMSDYYGDTQKEQWREAVQCVERFARPGDTVLVTTRRPAWYIRSCYGYYARRKDLAVHPLKFGKTGPLLIDDREASPPRVWYLKSTSGRFSERVKRMRKVGYPHPPGPRVEFTELEILFLKYRPRRSRTAPVQ